MLKDLSKSMKWISIILLLIVCVFIVYSYSNDKGRILDKMTDFGSVDSMPTTSSIAAGAASVIDSDEPIMTKPMRVMSNDRPMQRMASAPSAPSVGVEQGYNKQPVADPSELLPKDQNSQWATLNPLNGSTAIPVDLLGPRELTGLDTIGQTLKNANLQLRSDPIIEKKNVGPWMQSTIEPDYGRIPLEIGYGGR